MPVLKLDYRGDIRRFTLEDSISLKLVKAIVVKSFGLLPSTILLTHLDENGNRLAITSEDHFREAMLRNKLPALRLNVETVEASPLREIEMQSSLPNPPSLIRHVAINTFPVNATHSEEFNPMPNQLNNHVERSASDTIVHSNSTSSTKRTTHYNNEDQSSERKLRFGELFAQEGFQDELSLLIKETMKTTAFEKLVHKTIESMIPSFVEIMKETAASKNVSTQTSSFEKNRNLPRVRQMNNSEVNAMVSNNESSSDSIAPLKELENFMFENVPQMVQSATTEITNAIKVALFDEAPTTPTTSEQTNLNSNVNPNPTPVVVPVVPVHHYAPSFMTIHHPDEKPIEVAKIIEQPKKEEEEIKVEKVEVQTPQENNESDDFTLIDNNTETPTEGGPSLVNSVISFLTAPIRNLASDEHHIPNIDELMEKLESMGFHDKEANRKTLIFHKKFNEGLDAVVEDLLIQSTISENSKEQQQQQ